MTKIHPLLKEINEELNDYTKDLEIVTNFVENVLLPIIENNDKLYKELDKYHPSFEEFVELVKSQYYE